MNDLSRLRTTLHLRQGVRSVEETLKGSTSGLEWSSLSHKYKNFYIVARDRVTQRPIIITKFFDMSLLIVCPKVGV